MNLQELLEQQRSLITTARAENRSLTDEESAQYDDLQRQIDEILARRSAGAQPEASQAAPASADPQQAERSQTVPAQTPTPAPAGTENPERSADNAAIMAERQRINDIMSLCRSLGVDDQTARTYVNQGMSMDQVRAAVLDGMMATHQPLNVQVGQTGAERRAAAASDAIMMRAGVHIEHPAQGAEDFRGASLRQIAARCLSDDKNGRRDYFMMDASNLFDELCSRSYLTPEAAFPAILDQTIEKSYVDGWRTAPVTFDHFVATGTLTDFKSSPNRYAAGSFGEFLKVGENGELKATTPSDEKLPNRKLETYGRQFTLSRQAFIDDDIGLITRLPRQAAAASRTTQNKQVYQILVNNPAIYDGAKLFGTAHKNMIKTGTGVTRDAVETMILALGNHQTKDGDAILIRPAVIAVPLGYKFDMYTLFQSETIDNAGTKNPLLQYASSIDVVEDATLNSLVGSGKAVPWFMFGDKNDAAAIQVDYLNGQQTPQIRRMEVAGRLGFVWDVYLDWGISVQDFRGVVENPGVAVKSPLELA